MALTLIPLPLPADAAQQETLRQLFNSPGYMLLKEIVAAHCIEHQCKAAEALCYQDGNEDAAAVLKGNIKRATEYSNTLDVLDLIEQMPDKWFTVKVETRR